MLELLYSDQYALVRILSSFIKKYIDCSSACDECRGPTPAECLSCKKGFYLALNDPKKSYGTCVQMNNTVSNFVIYVTPDRNFSSY